MYEFWYQYIKPKCKNIIWVFRWFHCSCQNRRYLTEDIAKDVVKMSDTSNYELEKLLPKGKKNKKYYFNER